MSVCLGTMGGPWFYSCVAVTLSWMERKSCSNETWASKERQYSHIYQLSGSWRQEGKPLGLQGATSLPSPSAHLLQTASQTQKTQLFKGLCTSRLGPVSSGRTHRWDIHSCQDGSLWIPSAHSWARLHRDPGRHLCCSTFAESSLQFSSTDCPGAVAWLEPSQPG